jgi:hypothetical protein
MAKSKRIIPKGISDPAIRGYLQDLRDDLGPALTTTFEVFVANVSDKEVRTVDAYGALPIVDGFALEVKPVGDSKVQIRFLTGSGAKIEARVLLIKRS